MKLLRKALLPALLLACLGAWFWLQALEHSYSRPYSLEHNYDFIEEGLYLGGSIKTPPPGTTAVVNLCGKADPYQVEVSHWAPVFEKGKEPSLDWLRQVVEFIDSYRRAGRTTYVHCLAGVNRSAAAVTAFLMYKHGWKRDEALKFVQAKRSIVQPNPVLMRLLAEWEQSLRDRS